MSWIKDEAKNLENKDSNYITLVDGTNTLTINIAEPPSKRGVASATGERFYHDFKTENGKVLSATPYLYGEMIRELTRYDTTGKSWALVEIRKQKNAEGKVAWSVFCRETK